MSEFTFSGIDREGRQKRGRITAENRQGAAAALRATGLRVMAVEEASAELPFWQRDILGGDRPSRKDVLAFFQDFSTLLEANLTVDRALRLTHRQATPRMRPVLARLIEDVVAGRALSEAMRVHGNVFARSSLEIIRAGEMTGTLPAVTVRIAEAMRRQEEMRSAITSALIYPAVLMVMAVVILGIVVSSLLPSIAPLFDAPGVVPPLPIRLLNVSKALLQDNWPYLLASLLLTIVVAVAWWRNTAAQRWRSALWRRMPLIGPILTEIDVGRTCRMLGTLVAARVPLPQALAVCENIPFGETFRETLAAARRRIQEGSRLADALQPLYAAAPQMIDMIRTGEEVNRLDDMLLRVADLAEAGVKTRIDRLFTLLTPVITAVMGLMIGGLIMSIMSAILSVNDLTATP